ncbi:hypothetical protein COL13_06110 [Bacillus cereus]|nr:hypothetical protein COL13_06110 [Bacillus cereus]
MKGNNIVYSNRIMIPSPAEKPIAINSFVPNSRQKKPEIVFVSKPQIRESKYTILKTPRALVIEWHLSYIYHDSRFTPY